MEEITWQPKLVHDDNGNYLEEFLFGRFLHRHRINMLDSNLDERRQDLFQTSAGVGHQYRPGYYFPSSNFKVCSFFSI